VAFHGVCGVPASARAVAVTLSVMNSTATGYLALYPSDVPPPGIALVTYNTGETRSGNALVRLATDGTGTLDAAAFFGGPGSAHLAIDVAGYFE